MLTKILLFSVLYLLAAFLIAGMYRINIVQGFKPSEKGDNVVKFWFVFLIISAVYIYLIIATLHVDANKNQLSQFEKTKIEDFQKIEISCHENNPEFPYPCKKLTITNKDRIRKYQQAVLKSKPYKRNHPDRLWTMKIVFYLVNNTNHSFLVRKTDRAGMLISYYGMNKQDCYGNDFQTYRNDAIEALILEEFENVNRTSVNNEAVVTSAKK